jgi:hypothetical protein
VKPKTALLIDQFGWIVFALAGMILWVAMALAGDALEIGKSYVVRDHTKGPLAYQFTKVPLRRGETITILEREERNSFGGAVYLTQRESGERVQISAFVLEDALKDGLLALPQEPRPVFRSSITYSPGEPEGYKSFKWGMTYDQTREFYHPRGDFGRKNDIPFSSAEASAERMLLNRPFKDSIGRVSVTVSLRFLPAGPVKSESKLSSVLLSFESKNYETLKEISIERYGKPTSSQKEPYKTQGGAESTNEILMWQGPHSFIRLSRYGNRITEGSAMMGTNESLEAFSKKRDEEIKDAAKGL